MNKKILIVFTLFLHLTTDASYKKIAHGVYYQHVTTKNFSKSIHVLTVNPHYAHISLAVANNECANAQKTSTIAQQHHAVAAINGGFFSFGCKNKALEIITKIFDYCGYRNYNAFPVYTLQQEKNLYSVSHSFTGAVSWNQYNQQPLFNLIKTEIFLTINQQNYLVNELNKPHPHAPTLYSPSFAQKTPQFDTPVTEIIIEKNLITAIHQKSRGKTTIPKNGLIYVLPKKYSSQTETIKIGDPVSVDIMHYQKAETDLQSHTILPTHDNILASTPLLLSNNQIPESLKNSTASFYTTKHPRSAVGLLKNGNWVFVVVDGRQKHKKGFTILELAHFMQKLGCTDALNLDGGGSSTMVIHNKIINSPSNLFCKERPVSNAIVILPK